MDTKIVEAAISSYSRGKSIRRNLPSRGKLVINQKLPYLCIYRFPDKPDPYLASLLKTQAAYLIVHKSTNIEYFLEKLIEVAIEDFKSFMIVEVWNDETPGNQSTFKIYHPAEKESATIQSLKKGLGELSQLLPRIQVETEGTLQRAPVDFPPLVSFGEIRNSGTLLIGISVPPLFRDEDTNLAFPLFFRKIKRKFAEIIKVAAFEFVRGQTESNFANYLMLGKTTIGNLVRMADRRIAAIDEKMNFILTVTPVNVASAWQKFQENKFSKIPSFTYRLVSIDPEAEKRNLFKIPLENIEDPTLAFLLRDKRTELEKQLLMLEERGTRNFFHLSQSIYGDLDGAIVQAAKSILDHDLPAAEYESESVNATAFAAIAQRELAKYRESFPGLDLQVRIKDNVTGLIVSGPELSVGTTLSISEERVNALIQHEIGTHILTYCNGHRQPFHLMYAGLAGYEQMQEGLAVLAEYLVGGLNINRLRMLAARVLAVNALIDGADFIECFQLLRTNYDFHEKTAFNITMRVFRGGGYTKDAIYLKGLIQVLNYIENDGDLTHLYLGKYALEHLPFIEELLHLKILQKPVLPEYLTGPVTKDKIKKIKEGADLTDLVTWPSNKNFTKTNIEN